MLKRSLFVAACVALLIFPVFAVGAAVEPPALFEPASQPVQECTAPDGWVCIAGFLMLNL